MRKWNKFSPEVRERAVRIAAASVFTFAAGLEGSCRSHCVFGERPLWARSASSPQLTADVEAPNSQDG